MLDYEEKKANKKNRKHLKLRYLRLQIVDSKEFEPSSKQGINKLSICVALI